MLISYTLLSEILGGGVGPGVDKDYSPLKQEQPAYRFETKTQQVYDNAERERQQRKTRDRELFENFYRELFPQKDVK